MGQLDRTFFLMLIAVGALPASAQHFTDMQSHWAQKAVQSLTQANVVAGYPNGQFRPDANVTRAEAIIMVLKALNMGPQDRTESATPGGNRPEAWAQRYLDRAREQGLIDAADGSFDGTQPATRAEVAAIAVRGLEKAGMSVQEPTTPQVFSDVPESTAARREIHVAAASKLVKGYPDATFRPGKPVTRAEAVAMVARLHEAAREKVLGSSEQMTSAPNTTTPLGPPSRTAPVEGPAATPPAAGGVTSGS